MCPVFGIALKTPNGKRSDATPTLDRIDPTKGYTKDNVRVISWKANRLKNGSTLRELRLMVAYVERETLNNTA